jgi:hypothetical protein
VSTLLAGQPRNQGSIFGGAKIFFSSSHHPDWPFMWWTPRAISPGVKWPRQEADHSPASGAKVKFVWSYTSIPPYMFMAWSLTKHRNNFTFYLILATCLEPPKHPFVLRSYNIFHVSTISPYDVYLKVRRTDRHVNSGVCNFQELCNTSKQVFPFYLLIFKVAVSGRSCTASSNRMTNE